METQFEQRIPTTVTNKNHGTFALRIQARNMSNIDLPTFTNIGKSPPVSKGGGILRLNNKDIISNSNLADQSPSESK